MPSEIYNSPIVTDFPVSNDSNDTRVFRENYLAIEKNLQAASSEVDAITGQLGTLESEVTGLTSSLASLDAAVTDYFSETGPVSLLTDRLDSLEVTTQGHITDITLLQLAVDQTETDITGLQTELSDVTGESGSIDTINSTLGSLDGRITIVEDHYLDTRTDSDLAGNQINNVALGDVTLAATVNSTEVIDVTAGHYIILPLPDQATVTYSFSGFVDGKFKEAYLELRGGAQTTEIGFDLANTVIKSSELPENFLINTGDTHVLHVWSYDGAANLFVKYLGSYS